MKNNHQNLSSWGNYPKIINNVINYTHGSSLKNIISKYSNFIPFGNGRSYGDSALNKNIINMKPQNYFLHFDDSSGLLHIQAGVLLSEIIDIFINDGWFLKTTPGTKYITVGGAIASDIHGKNHHIDGCFSESVQSFRLMLPNGKILNCSHNENTELFRATCGGMGLTGIILDAKIYLIKINSIFIDQITVKANNLIEIFKAFETYKEIAYSVAWIDCLAKKENIGRGIFMAGSFNDDGDLTYDKKKKFNIPFTFPSFFLNSFTVKIFNWFYYQRVRKSISKSKVSFDSFFYPLDQINNWNKIYGKNGFTQYQFILPLENSYKGLLEILNKISMAKKGSFLAVLKLYSESNENFLSFPMKGYSLALDFKIEKDLFNLLDELDKLVIKYKGRIYLAKDVRVTKENFEVGYPHIEKFRKLRKEYGLNGSLTSLQSIRVGI